MSATPKPPYPKPPITEGVIHLAVAGIATADELQKLAKRFNKDYPQQEDLAAFSVTIDTTGGPATVQQQQQGYRLKSLDQADIVMAFPNGIAAARLAPYPGWEHLRDRAIAAWAEWRKVVAYSDLKRIGIRYINRIDVPIKNSETLDLQSYLRFRPRVPNYSAKPMTGYMLQATKPTELEHWNVSITSTIVTPPPLINHVSLLLDIDVFRTESLPGRDTELWAAIEFVQPLKNHIFEACITDEARKLFA